LAADRIEHHLFGNAQAIENAFWRKDIDERNRRILEDNRRQVEEFEKRQREREQRVRGWAPEECARLFETCWNVDLRNALRHLDAIDGSIGDARRAAETLLADRWDAVERVARALAERGALTGPEIDGEIVRRARP